MGVLNKWYYHGQIISMQFRNSGNQNGNQTRDNLAIGRGLELCLLPYCKILGGSRDCFRYIFVFKNPNSKSIYISLSLPFSYQYRYQKVILKLFKRTLSHRQDRVEHRFQRRMEINFLETQSNFFKKIGK